VPPKTEMPGLPVKATGTQERGSPALRKQTRRAGVASPAPYKKRRKEWRHELAATEKEKPKNAGLKPGATKTKSEERRKR